MHIKHYCILLIFLMFGAKLAYSQDNIVKGPYSPSRELGVDSIDLRSESQSLEDWNRQLHIKTNVVGLGLAIANLSFEVDLARHWSFALPINYSAWDYFKPTTKFRTLSIYPEGRFWISQFNRGFFVGAHFGMAYYNYALDGIYRYQDHDGKSPSLGGGLSVGYRLPLSQNKRWNIEFAVGAGVYSRHYDTFYNVKEGKLYDTTRKIYWGLDNVAINLSYSFDLKKRK